MVYLCLRTAHPVWPPTSDGTHAITAGNPHTGWCILLHLTVPARCLCCSCCHPHPNPRQAACTQERASISAAHTGDKGANFGQSFVAASWGHGWATTLPCRMVANRRSRPLRGLHLSLALHLPARVPHEFRRRCRDVGRHHPNAAKGCQTEAGGDAAIAAGAPSAPGARTAICGDYQRR